MSSVALASRQPPPHADSLLGRIRLAECHPVQVQQRVAAEHQRVRPLPGHRRRLALGEHLDQRGRFQELVGCLVDAADQHLGVHPGVTQDPQPPGRARGKHEGGGLLHHAVSVTSLGAGIAAPRSGAEPVSMKSADPGMRSDRAEGCMRLSRVADLDRVAWANLAASENDRHHAGFADEPAVVVPVKHGLHQAGPEPVELSARVAQAGDLDHRLRPEHQQRASRAARAGRGRGW